MADFETRMDVAERAEYEDWLNTVEEDQGSTNPYHLADFRLPTEKQECPTCGGANFPEPPNHNYEAYKQVICPTCGAVDWEL